MFNWIQDFLRNKKFQVRTNETFSKKYNIENGTAPQGSSISPLLFLIMMKVAFLEYATIEYSLESVCVCVCVCTITQKEIDLGTQYSISCSIKK